MRFLRRRWVPAFSATLLWVAFLAPATSAAVPSTGDPGRELADADRNGLSDDLQARLSRGDAGERVAVIVTFDGPGTVASARHAVGPFDVTRRFSLIDGFAAVMTGAQARALAARPGVFRVEPDFLVEATMDAADRDFGTEAARTTYGVDGSGVEVCVVDTGVDPAHEQLDSKTSLGAPTIAFYDAVNGRTAPYDDHGHGTHVASIAVGDGTGGADAARYGGVAPGASLSAAKVLSSAGTGTASQIIAGIQWCAARPSVRIVSMSLGTSTRSDGKDSISLAVNNAVLDAGKVVVVAAGNSGDGPSVGSPGAAAQALTVGAVSEWSAPPGAPNHSDGVFLASFSSRGPTLDGRTKPDVTAPGVTITAADGGTTAGYVTFSGTSMATPFVSGTAALALQARPTWTPQEVRAAVEATAQDRGPSGKDDDWGSGLLDGLAVVAAAKGSTGQTTFPTNTHVVGTVTDHGTWTHAFTVGAGDLGVPIAATILIDGVPTCVLGFGGLCLQYDWGPDLEAELLDPSGAILSRSTCAVGAECGMGRQETLHAMPTMEGTYTIRVYPYEGDPFDGVGGSFSMDLSTGAVGTGPPPPPPPPPPPSVHVADLDGTSARYSTTVWNATVVVTVHDGAHAPRAEVVVSAKWEGGYTGTCTTGANGTCSISRRFRNTLASRTFTVRSLTLSGFPYAQTDNHDPDGESNGTVIAVTRPF